MPLLHNLRFALRQLRKSPAFTLTILLTLALCIGANTAIFSLADSVFFRPLPYPQPNRLIQVVQQVARGGASGRNVQQTGLAWELIRDHATLIDPAVYPGGASGVNLVSGHNVEYIQQQRVSSGFFHVLGVRPLAGREFTKQEDASGGADVAIVSYAFWKRLFHGDRSIVGRSIDLRGASYTVIGIMPRDFRSDAPVDVWTPVRATHSGEGGGTNFKIIGRKPGVTLAAASGQLTAICKPVLDDFKHFTSTQVTMGAIPLNEGLGDELRPKVKLMWAAVGLVLLIGCVNIAGLLLSRSAVRSREMATRLALGAGRARVVAQLLAESVLLALAGGAAGVFLGAFALKALRVLSPAEFASYLGEIHLDARVLAVMLLISLATSILFGLFPAFDATAVDLRSALAEGARGSSSRGRKWRRQSLVFVEVALGVMLVFAAGLLIRTFAKLVGETPGFNADHVLTATLSLQDARYQTTAQGARLFKDSLDRIRQIPGVASAAVASTVPYQRPLNINVTAITGEDITHNFNLTNMAYVTPDFFETLEIHLRRGRLLAASDNASAAKVTVINQAFLRTFFKPNSQPLGSSVKVGDDNWQVVGIIDDIPAHLGFNGLGAIDRFPQIYVTAEQFPSDSFALINTWFSPNWLVRTRGVVAGLPDAMRSALQSVDPTLPFSSFQNMSEVRGTSIATQRYLAILFSSLAGLALLLAALGIYGLVAQSVTQRTREMGIRLALGATARQVVRLAVAPGLWICSGGIATGLVLGFFAARFLKSMIWGVTASDPVTLVAVAALLLAITLVASLIPAFRLTRLDPARTLRDE